jgi:DNA-binding MarR family transcriptional regulator
MNKTIQLKGPDQCYCLASRRSARYLTRLYERHLAPSGMTSSQFSILSFLDHTPDMTVADLAHAMEMERTTLVRTLKPMKDLGWIEEGAQKVGRAVILGITRAGLEKLRQSRPLWQAAQEAFEQDVGKQAASQLRRMALTALSHAEG